MPSRDDPFGLAFGPRRPRSGFAPVIRPETRDTHAPSLVSTLGDLWARQWRAATSPGAFADMVGAGPEREGGVNSLDPTTRMGMENWSALFSPKPGGSGGHWRGRQDFGEVAQMRSLKNVSTKRYSQEVLDALAEAGVPPETIERLANTRIYESRAASDVPLGADRKWMTGGRRGGYTPEVQQLMEQFGQREEDPMDALERSVLPRNVPGFEQQARIESKLGIGRDEAPNWLYPRGMQRLFEPSSQRGSLDASERQTLRGMDEEMSDDQRIALAAIIETIRRRQGR